MSSPNTWFPFLDGKNRLWLEVFLCASQASNWWSFQNISFIIYSLQMFSTSLTHWHDKHFISLSIAVQILREHVKQCYNRDKNEPIHAEKSPISPQQLAFNLGQCYNWPPWMFRTLHSVHLEIFNGWLFPQFLSVETDSAKFPPFNADNNLWLQFYRHKAWNVCV